METCKCANINSRPDTQKEREKKSSDSYFSLFSFIYFYIVCYIMSFFWPIIIPIIFFSLHSLDFAITVMLVFQRELESVGEFSVF